MMQNLTLNLPVGSNSKPLQDSKISQLKSSYAA